MKYSPRYKISQGDESSRRMVVLDTKGQPTFVLKETGPRKPTRLKRKHKPWSNYRIVLNCNLVLKDLKRLIEHEFGGPCDTDDGELLFEQALPFIVAKAVASHQEEDDVTSQDWAWNHTRKLIADNPRSWFAEAEHVIRQGFEEHDGRPSIPDRNSVSVALGLTAERVAAAGLRHLQAADRTPAMRERDRKAYDRDRKATGRRKAGAAPHEASREKASPWAALGVSRATYYRNLADGKIVELGRSRKPNAEQDASIPASSTVLRLVSA